MLIGAGKTVKALIDYTNHIDQGTIEITQAQGDTLPEMKCQITDQKSQFTLIPEDEIVVLDENDTNGWPTINLLNNGSMEGTYASGIAPSWTGDNTGASGVAVASSASSYVGSKAQQITFTAVANGTTSGFVQNVQLPVDENGSVLSSISYCLSAWEINGSIGDATIAARILWKNSGGGSISSNSATFDASLVNTWQFSSIIATPPANATQADIGLRVTINTGGGGGAAVRWDAIQFEPITFGQVKSLAYTPQIVNPKMGYHGSGGVVDGWLSSATTGGTFSVVTSPSLYGSAQKITTSNATANQSNQIQQSDIELNPWQTYSFSMQYQLAAAFGGTAAMRFGGNYSTSSHSFISSTPFFTVTNVPINTWLTYTLRIGPGTTAPIPSNAAFLQIFAGVDSGTSGTNSAQLIIGSITITPDPSSQQGLGREITAQSAGLYPTPFCDSGQPGCFLDQDLSGLWYRQLRLFGGYARKTSFDYSNSPERVIDIDAVGYGVLLQEAPANFIIQATTDSLAISSAFTYARAQGFLQGINYTLYVSTIGNVDSMTFNWQTTKDVINQIANANVAAYFVDDYKYLHYKPNLATNGPYAVSDAPNLTTSFPFVNWKYDNDSTQTITQKIFEGSTVLSIPQTQSDVGMTTTTTANLTGGVTYTSVSVTATTQNVRAGTVILFTGGETAIVTVAASSGATTFTIASFTPTATITSGASVSATGYTLNSGNAIAQIDSLTVGGVGKTVGINGINDAGSFDALIDLNSAIITLASAPSNGTTVVTVYRYAAPVIVRLQRPTTSTGRVIHHHQKEDSITSIKQAVNRANAELNQYNRARPIGSFLVYSPPAPMATPLRPGTAISLTHTASGLSAQLFQIQTVRITQTGPGTICYECGVGYYRPDFAIQYAHTREKIVNANTVNTQGQAITDVLSQTDGWVVTDAVSTTVTNVGEWDGPSTWDSSTYTWG